MFKKIKGLFLTMVLTGSLLTSGIPFAFAVDTSSNSSMNSSDNPATDMRKEDRRLNRREMDMDGIRIKMFDPMSHRRNDNPNEIENGVARPRTRVNLFNRTSHRINGENETINSGTGRLRIKLFSGSFIRRGETQNENETVGGASGPRIKLFDRSARRGRGNINATDNSGI